MKTILVIFFVLCGFSAQTAEKPNIIFLFSDDPAQHAISASDATKPEVAAKFAELKAEITRLQKEFKDDGRYADSATWPKGDVDGPFDDKPPGGTKTVAEAIALSVSK